MSKVMPSQIVQTIDELFPHAATGEGGILDASHGSRLRGIRNLFKEVPPELIILPPGQYADLILAISAIEEYLGSWTTRGYVQSVKKIKDQDIVTVIRQALALCPDEYPPITTTELVFIHDDALRDSIRRDAGAVHRALDNAEWKAATVLAGSTIEALLHWKIQEHPQKQEIEAALKTVVIANKATKPRANDPDTWDLAHFIEVAAEMKFIEPETQIAANLARNFRNLIHPGRAIRLKQTCDRATAYSAVGALEHVIRNLS